MTPRVLVPIGFGICDISQPQWPAVAGGRALGLSWHIEAYCRWHTCIALAKRTHVHHPRNRWRPELRVSQCCWWRVGMVLDDIMLDDIRLEEMRCIRMAQGKIFGRALEAYRRALRKPRIGNQPSYTM